MSDTGNTQTPPYDAAPRYVDSAPRHGASSPAAKARRPTTGVVASPKLQLQSPSAFKQRPTVKVNGVTRPASTTDGRSACPDTRTTASNGGGDSPVAAAPAGSSESTPAPTAFSAGSTPTATGAPARSAQGFAPVDPEPPVVRQGSYASALSSPAESLWPVPLPDAPAEAASSAPASRKRVSFSNEDVGVMMGSGTSLVNSAPTTGIASEPARSGSRRVSDAGAAADDQSLGAVVSGGHTHAGGAHAPHAMEYPPSAGTYMAGCDTYRRGRKRPQVYKHTNNELDNSELEHGRKQRERTDQVDPALLFSLERTLFSALNVSLLLSLTGVGLMSVGPFNAPHRYGVMMLVAGALFAGTSFMMHAWRLHRLSRFKLLWRYDTYLWAGTLCVLMVMALALELHYGVQYPYLKRSATVEVVDNEPGVAGGRL